MKLQKMELNAVLAGLRLLQWNMENDELWQANKNSRMGGIREIYEDGAEENGEPLTVKDIDDLCERLNCGEELPPIPIVQQSKAMELIGTISRMLKDGESQPGLEDEEEEFEMSSDDAVETVNSLIDRAREIVSGPLPVPNLFLVIEGGIVQEVISDNPEAFIGLRVELIDYDTDGGSRKDMSVIPQADGTDSLAYTGSFEVGKATINLGGIRNATKED